MFRNLVVRLAPVVARLNGAAGNRNGLSGLPLFSFLFGLTREVAEKEPIATKPKMYWQSKSITEIIDEADELFNKGYYLEVYELLNRLKFSSNAEVQWRISRALFKLSRDEAISKELRREMIYEAYELMRMSIELERNNPNIYKWMAIVLDAKNGLDGLLQRVRSYQTVKDYLEMAVSLNPEDAVSLYILGKWCFEMSKLSYFQRMITSLLYGKIPTCTFHDAYEYLLKAYEIHPDSYYIPNMYMLGETCFRLNQFYRARYYLNAAATLPARNEHEKACAAKAKTLLKRLDIYDLAKETILFEFPF